jgi:hypothetical protein
MLEGISRMLRTCWVDLSVNEQLKERLGDVKPEPDGFLFPRKVLKVGLIYDIPISERGGFSQKRRPVLLPAYRIL